MYENYLCSPPDACLLASVITLLYPDRPAICPYRKTKSREGVARSRLPPSRPTVLPPNCNITRSCPVFLPSTGRGSGEGVRGMWRRQRGARAAPRRQAPAARIGAAPEAIQCECQVVRDFHWGVVAAVFPVAVCGEPPGKRAAAVLHAPHAASPCCQRRCSWEGCWRRARRRRCQAGSSRRLARKTRSLKPMQAGPTAAHNSSGSSSRAATTARPRGIAWGSARSLAYTVAAAAQ